MNIFRRNCRLSLFKCSHNFPAIRNLDTFDNSEPYRYRIRQFNLVFLIKYFAYLFLPKNSIPENILSEIAIEGKFLSELSIHHFITIVSEQLPEFKLYEVPNYHNVGNYKPHLSKTDDVQILYGEGAVGHVICIEYKASSRTLHVYDSLMQKTLDTTQLTIIQRLYPNVNDRIVYEQPKTIQTDNTSCGVFAILYATTLMLKKDPVDTAFKLNNVHGDETLYMRIHILKMFAHRKLQLFQ